MRSIGVGLLGQFANPASPACHTRCGTPSDRYPVFQAARKCLMPTSTPAFTALSASFSNCLVTASSTYDSPQFSHTCAGTSLNTSVTSSLSKVTVVVPASSSPCLQITHCITAIPCIRTDGPGVLNRIHKCNAALCLPVIRLRFVMRLEVVVQRHRHLFDAIQIPQATSGLCGTHSESGPLCLLSGMARYRVVLE